MSEVNIMIIDIDLGRSVEDIIGDSITTITSENKNMIDEVIKEANLKQEAIAALAAQKEKAEQDRADMMQALYDAVSAASADGGFLPASDILAICAPEMPNMISFVGRMRNWLKANNKAEKLTQIKRAKASGYRLDAQASE